jgi:hypothetical protein
MHRPTQAVRLSTYATLAAGTTVAGSAAIADVIIVDDFGTKNASSNFTLNLSPAGYGGIYTFSNIGLSNFFYGRASASNQPATQQFVATRLVGTNVFLDANFSSWLGVGNVAFTNPAAGTTAYLGFRLTLGGGASRFGWIEYVNDGSSVTVSRWAYEGDVNTGISTPAASGGGGGAVPGLGGLAALACGAAGMRRSRNRVA